MIELKDDRATIRGLLNELPVNFSGESCAAEDGIDIDQIAIRVNSGGWESLSECLERPLRDGDRVFIARMVNFLGGG